MSVFLRAPQRPNSLLPLGLAGTGWRWLRLTLLRFNLRFLDAVLRFLDALNPQRKVKGCGSCYQGLAVDW